MVEPKYRSFGKNPYSIILLHGGPGAWGEMAPLAQILSPDFGSLELFQIQTTLDGQLREIYEVIQKAGDEPVIIIGFSWGAWLAYLFAAEYGDHIEIAKTILIGSGPYEQKYFSQLQATRLSRMDSQQREFYLYAFDDLEGLSREEKEIRIQALGQLCEKIDHVDPLSEMELENIIPTVTPPKFDVDRTKFFQQAMESVMDYRKSGKLITFADQIKCPVVAIHGDYDPHPYQGVFAPLSARLSDFSMEILPKCGHKPWIERQVREKFINILKKYIQN